MSKSTVRFLKKHEDAISSALSEMDQDFVFSVSGHRTRQQNNYKTWKKYGLLPRDFKDNVHRSFRTINCERRSMACVREQSRAKIALTAYVFPVFKCLLLRSELPVHFVTIVQPQHYTDIGQLNQVKARRVLRKFDDGMRGLRKEFPDAVGAAAVEIITYEDRDEHVQYHPHVHALIAGVPYGELREALTIRKSSKQRANFQPLRIDTIKPEFEIAQKLLYMTKFKAHLSYPHESKYTYGSRSSREMPVELKAEWLEWMSQNHISDIFSLSGISSNDTSMIYNAEMEVIVQKFLKIARSVHA